MNIEQGMASENLKKSDYEYFPRTLAADDFWGQVRRTVHGEPVGEEQIEMIVAAILGALRLRADDVVLDLACGNGALSSRLYDSCAALLGVDLSEFLISVAEDNFERPPRYVYRREDAAHYVQAETDPARFTKALCYGSFSFFPPESCEIVLTQLRERFVNVESVFLGNLPDRDTARLFFAQGVPEPALLDDHTEQIGTWRSKQEMTALARRCGWDASFSTMSPDFFSKYRYDVLLTPA
ncbi:MAG: class I SAM-dependent methyltransferase [Solirubrobacteraceae bacterium]